MKSKFKLKRKIIYFGASLIIIGGLGFGYYLYGIVFTLLFSETTEFNNFLYNKNEAFNLEMFRIYFWMIIAGIIIFFSSGGKLEDF